MTIRELLDIASVVAVGMLGVLVPAYLNAPIWSLAISLPVCVAASVGVLWLFGKMDGKS